MEKKKLQLHVFSETESKFPREATSVWATVRDIQDILPEGVLPDKQPNYVKITSSNLLTKFTLYAKIDCLNEKKEAQPDGQLWLPARLMRREWNYAQQMDVEVSYVDPTTLQHADVVTISLNPKEVLFWGSDEEETARGRLAHLGVVSMSQMILVKPLTKDSVMGEVAYISPRPENHNQAYQIDDTTKIEFTGLSGNKQKTIDFSKIGGLDKVIKGIREIIQIPINFPELLQRFGINPPKGMILYGPPGNGKTMIARAVAHSLGASFFEVERSELLSQYVSISEKNLTRIFTDAAAKGNSVIFIDEIDALASVRTEKSEEHQISLIATLLVLMDGINSNHQVFVIGATNRLEAVDPALRRPGRFELEVEIPLPDLSGREDILRKKVPLNKPELLDAGVNDRMLTLLSELTSGYSGADMDMLYREAAMQAIRRNMKFDEAGKIALNTSVDDIKLTYDDFLAARKAITPTQMRGEQTIGESIEWDEVVGLDSQKETLEKLDANFTRCISDDIVQSRPSCANLLMVGRRGTGKRTLTSAFAKKYGYEMMSIDCVELGTLSTQEAMQEIHRIVIKCRQSAPSILFIRNLDDCPSNDLVARSIINELSLVNRRLKLLAVLASEDAAKLPPCVRGYRAFEMEMKLDIDDASIVKGIKKMFPTAECTVKSVSGKTIGQVIRDQREKLVQDEIGVQ